MVEEDVLFFGDLHLESLNNLFGEKGNDYIFQSFANAVQYAYENGIKLVVQLGDIFDTPYPDQETTARLMRFCLMHPMLKFVFIKGNHDVTNAEEHGLRIMKFIEEVKAVPNLYLFVEPEYRKIMGIPFYFMPWPHKKRKPTDHPTLNIAHIKLSGTMADNGRIMEHGEEIEAGEDFWIIGDLHRYQKIGKRIVYPGTAFQKTFGEPLPKGFVHATIKYGKKLNVACKYIAVDPPFKLINVAVEKPEDLDQVVDAPNLRYKVFIKNDVAVPSNFMELHPSVVSISGFKNRVELDSIMNEGLSVDQIATMDADKLAIKNLNQFLQKKGFDDTKIKRARKLVRGMMEKLNNPED